ncbi:MAG: hypothetical protein KR126chlam2_01326, partial [Chlamydiae bacterium]|nr:hypothetical protein [Chlamydiota bacterium]
TTVAERSLFFTVPVRKRFQKRVEADVAEIHKILTKAALCFPAVKFTWINGEKQEFSLGRDEPLLTRIATLLGQELSDNLLPIDFEKDRCKIAGFISAPSLHRPNRLGNHLFLNRRAVFSPFISYRFVEAYGTRLPVHRYPLFVCHLALPPEWVDVNVHPQKREVRLREERLVGEFLMEAVERALGKRPEVVMPPRFVLPEAKPLMLAEEAPVYHAQAQADLLLPLVEKKIRGVGFVGGYFLAERRPGELLLVDERAARMRIYFEKMTKSETKMAQQALLFPLSVEFAPNEARFIQAHSDLLNEVGIGIRSFGKNAFVVDSIPQPFENEEIHLLLERLIEDLGGVKSPAKKELAFSLCRLIKRKKLSIEEGEKLVEELLKCEIPHECPRGRPTYICLDEETIKKDYFS